MHIQKYLFNSHSMRCLGNKHLPVWSRAWEETWNPLHPASQRLKHHFSVWSVPSTTACSWCWHRLGANKILAIMYLMMEEEVPKRRQLLLSRICGQQAVGANAKTLNIIWQYHILNVQILRRLQWSCDDDGKSSIEGIMTVWWFCTPKMLNAASKLSQCSCQRR